MENIEVLDFRDFYILVSKVNGNTLSISREIYNNREVLNQLLEENRFFVEVKSPKDFDKELFKTVYISLHTSSQCNLKCTYCFKKEREVRNLTFEESKKFINMIMDEYPNAGKYIVDPTGSGEPLLNKELLYQIGEYCKVKSNELRREVLPMIVTNGTLLDNETVQEIRDAGILFGVSLDGEKKDNDCYRKDAVGQGVYKKVIRNVKNIKDRSLMGVAVTLTDKNTDLVKSVKHLIKYFPTISIKPVRSVDGSVGINESNIDDIKSEYTRLYEFLLSETMKGNLEYIAALLNGDDYFGKFLLRTILHHKVSTRCDAGIGRFSLTSDGNIYVCPGAIDIDELKIGTLKDGIDYMMRDKFWKQLTERKECKDCFARYVCGGECMVSSYYSTCSINKVDEVMCNLKRHLYKLSLLFSSMMSVSPFLEYLRNACLEKSKRFEEDVELSWLLSKYDGEYTFNELKKVKDEKYNDYKEILEIYKPERRL
jgi:uncharacterized protein